MDKKRRNRIAEQLQDTHQTMLPEMPCKHNADYEAWKIWFERNFSFINDEDLILIWHSLGGIFLAKYLSENQLPKKVKQLHFVAAVFEKEKTINFSYNPNKLNNLKNQCEKIFIYHSKDDPTVPFFHGEKYKEYLQNAEFLKFRNRGHFRQETFPELLENIRNN